MDKDTLIDSILYRCDGRGEDIEAFVYEFVTFLDIDKAMQSSDPDEAKVAARLFAVTRALQLFYDDWEAIKARRTCLAVR